MRRWSAGAQGFPHCLITGACRVPTKDAEGIMGFDVWGCCVTEHAEQVQEVLEAQAIPVWGCGEDPADSLLEGVGLGGQSYGHG